MIGLPRSGSSRAYTLAAAMLGLRQPSWTSDGEILNLDRHAAYRGRDTCAMFTTRDRDPDLFAQITEFLDTTARRDGCAYKDVVQPFIVADWSGIRDFRVLYVRRDPVEVAYAMLKRGWYYPETAVNRKVTKSEAVVRGLLLAERALEQVPATRIEFEQVIAGSDGLAAALRRLYPEFEPQPIDGVDDGFLEVGRVRQRMMQRSAEYRALQELVSTCRETP